MKVNSPEELSPSARSAPGQRPNASKLPALKPSISRRVNSLCACMISCVRAFRDRFSELQPNFYHSDGNGKKTIGRFLCESNFCPRLFMIVNEPVTELQRDLESRTVVDVDASETTAASPLGHGAEPEHGGRELAGTRAKAAWLCALTGFIGIASGFALFIQVSTEIEHGGHFFV